MKSKIINRQIKKIIKSQLKKSFQSWNSISKKEKIKIVNNAFNEYAEMNKETNNDNFSFSELIGIENQTIDNRIMSLETIENIINNIKYNNIIELKQFKRKSFINCNELSYIDEILDDRILDALLAYEGYSPTMRDIYPHQLLRAELLKSIKYPEISYRKFCTDNYFGMQQKENKDFVKLPINKNSMIDHTQLSKFRNSLQYHNLINILVFVIYLFKKDGHLENGLIHGIDSTDLAINEQSLLGSIEINGQKIRIYNDLNADCGKRRNKRDKSTYFVGYRMHTLTVINPENGHNYPLISLLAPANHHDSLFAHPLISLAQAIGLNVKLVTADEAYNDIQGHIYNDTGATIITPVKSNVNIPDFVDIECKNVFCNKNCLIPMDYLGTTDENQHEFKCNAKWGECSFSMSCPKYRFIPFDSGHFQRVHSFLEHADKAVDIRKHSERPFNLLKNREGLKETRAKSQHGILARCTFAQMATLLIEMAGTRKKKNPIKIMEEQIQLPIAA